ncbi:MAG: GTPase ObgE, partial [Lachnospiraceae bacterium]|nr:GTPase ObgE [Lachnospiraceae bacterium]
RREKFVPDGGPDGGDGGTGGDVIFQVDKGLNTLIDFRHVRKYKAGDGEEGGKKNCRGKDGGDVIIKVPEGTVIKEANSDKVIIDMSGDNQRVVLLKGGRGGNGNQHYATPTMQAPKYAQPGQPAQELELTLELKVIADVGLVGFPNVGKSTLLSRVTNARPKIANYHFTTLSPNLGVVDLEGAKGFVIADIPGLIEGASEGVGLGYEFLRHIERTKVIIHVVDAAGTEGRDPIADIYAINKELETYNPGIAERPQVIAANKMDAIYEEDADEVLKGLREEFEPKGIKVFPISAVSGQGLSELLYEVSKMLEQVGEDRTVFEREYFPEKLSELASEPYTVTYDPEEAEYVVEGPRIEKMLGYTNLDSEKGFQFFQKFLKENGILDELEKLGIKDGDTVRLYGLSFDYYK